ncbi:tRNA (adenosine(37)-N6)-threonylcarbamoyltransferase complex transferase subunit TsaD [Candidatus Gottesmanbacteria bacterium]|nr:tRNA (adenosine(37)-N6)-threonylcarbamoyltransferase complex transferase subunit TsaD [Candidatus Gottesmanbacteria bacterium]
MNILSIETSADETAAAIIEDGTKVLSNVVASSKELHDKTGGIIPEVAAREQIRYIIPVIREVMQPFASTQGKQLTMNNIDALAVTIGPGLNGSLLIGVETAKTVAFVTGKPLIPVNHIFAHIYANWLDAPILPTFPAIALVVSGGHTELFLMHSHKKIKWLGGTLDDAAGEAFDKTARVLGLGYPGGPAIAATAAKFQISNFKFQIIKLPRPMISSKDLNFSFSGLKTAVMKEINRLKIMKQFNNETISQLAYEIQESITDVLIKKTLDAAIKYKINSILLGGGVAANKKLSEKFKFKIENLKFKIDLHIPPPFLCTDNAAYIGSFAYFHNIPVPWNQINAQPDLTVEV